MEYTYHANGARATMTDQRGVVRAYTYDPWNRLTLDHATDLGAAGEGVDDLVRGIGTAYDQLGRTATITSYGDTNDNGILDVVRNQVQYGYDDYDAQANPAGWGGVARVWQEHDGAVNTGTSPSVQYAYDSLGRLTSMTHPSGFEVAYEYGAAGSIDNRLSRVAAVTNAAGTLDYAAYTYLGAGTIVGAARQLAVDGQPDQTLNLTYGTSQDGYGGLDRFGRVVDQLWELDAAAADHFAYGYTRGGNRLWRENVVAGNQNPAVLLDELYSYDELSRLIATERGRLVFDDPNPGDVSLTDAVFGQDWELDGLGNWLEFDDDGAQQTREHNEANEITAITGGWITPAYDSAGNMTSGPSPLDGTVRVHYAYDSWNRLVAVRADDSGQPGDMVAEYRYDGLGRRIGKTVPAGEAERATAYFYNESWQLLEARTAEGEAESATHYVWDLSYIDAPIARLFDGNADGQFTGPTDAVHYYTFDANQNVTALIGLVETEPDVFDWQVVERYTYTPYGVATAYDPDWSNPAAPTTEGPLYAGYHFDAETGLYHVRHRQYDAQLGIFTTRDPIGYAAGDANLYRYVGNDPVGALDPMGLQKIRLGSPDPSGISRLTLTDTTHPNEFICIVDVDGDVKWSLMSEEQHSGASVDFDYNWLRRDGAGTITIWVGAGEKYEATYSAQPTTHRVHGMSVGWMPIENLGLHFRSAVARVNYVQFTLTGPEFEMPSNVLPAVFDSPMRIDVEWTYNHHAGDGTGRLYGATSVFGTDARHGDTSTTELYEDKPPPTIGPDRRPRVPQRKVDRLASTTFHYWALMDRWFVIPADAKNDPWGGNSVVTVSAVLTIDTGVGHGHVPQRDVTIELPGRPRGDIIHLSQPGD